VEYHDVEFVGIDSVEDRPQVIKRVVVTDHNQDVPRSNADGLGSEVLTRF